MAMAAHFPIPLLAPVIMKALPLALTSRSALLKFFEADWNPLLLYKAHVLHQIKEFDKMSNICITWIECSIVKVTDVLRMVVNMVKCQKTITCDICAEI